MYVIKFYENSWNSDLLRFLQCCLPESGRTFDITGRHSIYRDVKSYFEKFWCLFNDVNIIGTVGLRKIFASEYELKSLYLYKEFYGQGLGYQLMMQAIGYAKERGGTELYLDTLATSERAISLYKKVGFCNVQRYNNNPNAEIFMKLDLEKFV